MKHGDGLLIIDMQKGSFTKDTPRHDTPSLIKRLNLISERFRQQHRPVFFIQHDGSAEKAFIPNTWQWEILDELVVKEEDIVVSKIANDAFYKSTLTKHLERLEITHLYIAGCATDFCVESTIQSALSKDFDITVISDGHTTADRPQLEAKKVIEHYNWIWQNMIPTQGKIELKSCQKIIEETI